MFYDSSQSFVYYSGLIYIPQKTFLMKENVASGGRAYIKEYDKPCNINSHTYATNYFYWTDIGNPSYVLLINLTDGMLNMAITPSGYICNSVYWDIALSENETHAFLIFQPTGVSKGWVCKWEVGTLNDADWICLGILDVPLFISRIVSNKVFLEAFEPVIDGPLYLVYLDLDTDDILWNK